MTNQVEIDAATAVDHSLHLAEASTNGAAIASTDLLLTLLRQHGIMGAPDAVGLTAIRHATKAASLAVEAREEHIRAHGALNLDLKKLGLDEMFSKDSNPPNPNFDWRTYAASVTIDKTAA